MGASGTYAGNLYRNLKTVFGFPSGCAPIEWVLIPTRVARETPHPVMMPHKFLQEVFRHRPDIWQQRFIGQSGAALEFWEHMAHTPYVRNHPFLPKSVWSKTIPLGFHGDGGAFN